MKLSLNLNLKKETKGENQLYPPPLPPQIPTTIKHKPQWQLTTLQVILWR
jgi:hypothetical protein